MLLGLAVGLVVTTVAAVLPAWSAARVSPMEALRVVVAGRRGSGRLRHAAGWLVTGGRRRRSSCVLARRQPALVDRRRHPDDLRSAWSSSVRRWPAGWPGSLSHGRRGGGWRMAARNIGRNSRRAAATALALTIGLTVVAAVAVTAASLKDSVTEAVSGGNRSDLILEPAGAGHGDQPVDRGPAARTRRRPGRRRAARVGRPGGGRRTRWSPVSTRRVSTA